MTYNITLSMTALSTALGKEMYEENSGLDWRRETIVYRTAASTRKPNTERNSAYENHVTMLTVVRMKRINQ